MFLVHIWGGDPNPTLGFLAHAHTHARIDHTGVDAAR
jgi:hypothetical protein